MVDVVYLAHGRSAFTEESLGALVANTDWSDARLVIYTDGSTPTWLHMAAHLLRPEYCGGPVAVMNDYLAGGASEIFAKIDNDVVVPPGWLNTCLAVMEMYPKLGLLGIEPPASRTAAPWMNGRRVPSPELAMAAGKAPNFAPCDAIGGIGIMRRSAFIGADRMQRHSLYGGFTDWQLRHPEVVKGWIVPPLKVFLLDRLPVEPWASLSRKYIQEGKQRPWTNYAAADADLWNWWTKNQGDRQHA